MVIPSWGDTRSMSLLTPSYLTTFMFFLVSLYFLFLWVGGWVGVIRPTRFQLTRLTTISYNFLMSWYEWGSTVFSYLFNLVDCVGFGFKERLSSAWHTKKHNIPFRTFDSCNTMCGKIFDGERVQRVKRQFGLVSRNIFRLSQCQYLKWCIEH